MKKGSFLLCILYLIVGVGACAGGIAAISDPIQPLGCSVAWLKHSPFNNYLIPGLILFCFFGIGNLIGLLLYLLKRKTHLYVGLVLGYGLVVFIFIQCLILQMVNVLHLIFFLIGWIQGSVACFLLYLQSLFPWPYILRQLEKFKH